MAKKSAYKVISESIAFNKLKDLELPTERVNYRRLSVDEIKKYLQEEFGKAKEAASVKAKEVSGWGDAELEKEMDWVKTLKLQEFFEKKKFKKDLNENANMITLRKERVESGDEMWVADFTGPHAAQIADVMGSAQGIPTAYTAGTSAEKVKADVASRNPGVTVVVKQ